MAAVKNAPIGTCPCPFKGCEELAAVYKFRARGDNELRRRHAGKLYVVCRVHGRAEPQEWILENARIEVPVARPVAPVTDEQGAPAAASVTESGAPASPAKAPAVRPVQRPVRPVDSLAPASERAAERWGFFE